jgi:hypothetical protein
MAMEQLDHAALLAEWEAKRAALDAAIASLRSALAMGVFGQVGELPPGNGFASTLVPSVSGGEVPAGAFLAKSIPDAAKLYLAIVKKKQTSREIADALKRGGMESTSKNFYGNVHSILDRARKANMGIVKLDRSYWGLAEWYPAGLRSTVIPDKRSTRKKGRKSTADKAKAVTAQPSSLALQPGKANERALEVLRGNPELSLADVAEQIGVGVKGTRLILGKMLKSGKVRMSAPGVYTTIPFGQKSIAS